ncbi:hypothetical protein Vretimale_6040 [Volvox reticuliferus]|uniref:Uncharacterized protein n=1 Tax=Volvox reticuliferus TaxID=1737510 RepID=A0A8J4G720_9CHLO|nr:hypothetical protein Vretifemale_6197 [Volvox reticuliferus]GIM01229.1 hypothetical protein Vretimale_6040 [Volvox reticuliferus]
MMASVRGRAPENRASPSIGGELLQMFETHEDLLVRAAVDSATEALQRELTATLLKLETQAEAMVKAHEFIQELQQELKNLHHEAKERVLEQDLLMQAVAESAREGARRDLVAAQEHIVQLQTALSTSRSKEQQAYLENKRLAAQVAMTQQLLAGAKTEAHELRRQLEEQLNLAENEAREAHQRYCGEVQALSAQLQAEEEAVARLQKEKAEAVTQLQAQKDEAAAQQGAIDGAALAEGKMGGNDDDAVMLRARCGALRRELESTQSQLASVTQAWEAAAQGRLAEKMAEAQSAAAAGRVKNDEEFWARNDEVHSLHTLVTSLRTTRLYAGAAGPGATYGDNRADGAGSVGMANSAQLAAAHRRTRLLQFRETLVQMGELLSGAEVMVKQRLQQSPHQRQPRQLQLPSSQPPSPPQLPSPLQLPSSPQPQVQGQQDFHASVWGRLLSFGNSSGRSRGLHQSCSSASSRNLSRTDSCATVSSCGTNSLHNSGSGCGQSMGVRTSTESLQQAATVGGSLADELADIYDLYQLPAQPKYEFSSWN